MRHMHAHLMGAPGLQLTFDQSGSREPLDRAVMGNRMLAASFAMHRHLLPIGVRSPDPGIDRSGGRTRQSIDDRGIQAIDAVRLELLREALMRAIRFGDDQQARRILVDPVHDARPRHAADAGQLAPAMMQQGINQRPVQVARSRMHH